MNSTLTRFRVQTALPLEPLKAWHAVSPGTDIRYVEDLTKDVVRVLGLAEANDEIMLELDGFALLPSSPAGVVRDGDIVTYQLNPVSHPTFPTKNPAGPSKAGPSSSEDATSSSSDSTSDDSDSSADSSSDPKSQPIPRQPLVSRQSLVPTQHVAPSSYTRATPSQPPVPPGEGKTTTKSRNARRRHCANIRLPVLPFLHEQPRANFYNGHVHACACRGLYNGHQNSSQCTHCTRQTCKQEQAKRFDRDMAESVATRIIYGTPAPSASVERPAPVDTPAESTVQTKSRYTHYHVVPPSERKDLPANVIDQCGCGSEEESTPVNDGPQPGLTIDWNWSIPNGREWDSYPTVGADLWSNLKAGILLGYKSLTIDPSTCTPCTKIHPVRVISGPSSDTGDAECFFIERPGAADIGFGYGGKFANSFEPEDDAEGEEAGESRKVTFGDAPGLDFHTEDQSPAGNCPRFTCGMLAHMACLWISVTGHQITATIAQIYLLPSARDAVCKILPPTYKCNLAGVASWPDEIKQDSAYHEYSKLHFVNAEGDKPPTMCVFGEKGWMEERNILEGIIDGARHVANADTSPIHRDHALRFLVHFLGDIISHFISLVKPWVQIKIYLVEAKWNKRDTNLHTVWDDHFIDHQVLFVDAVEYTNILPTAHSANISEHEASRNQRIESVLTGLNYDPYIRYILNGVYNHWAAEREKWIVCPEPSLNDTRIHMSVQSVLQADISHVDDFVIPSTLCPLHWAEETHPLLCTSAGQPKANVEKQLAMGGLRLASVLNSLLGSADEIKEHGIVPFFK
ncbi:Phospholipase C P1 nuclease [Rhizoctonia solani]|uniref:Phospholipase C P1 nuclease n=1 Tax=Rhizoctonia solani TaxID=456999 RepID=A0A8H7I3T9_9AGAM|nr:Phospholipase C P1 nuclease [Rhizoctonia solani]